MEIRHSLWCNFHTSRASNLKFLYVWNILYFYYEIRHIGTIAARTNKINGNPYELIYKL